MLLEGNHLRSLADSHGCAPICVSTPTVEKKYSWVLLKTLLMIKGASINEEMAKLALRHFHPAMTTHRRRHRTLGRLSRLKSGYPPAVSRELSCLEKQKVRSFQSFRYVEED